MTSARNLRDRIQRRQLTVGAIVTHHLWHELIEIARTAGLDFLIIDQEHVAFDEELVAAVCATARLLDFPVLIRPPESQYTFIRRALDKGAAGLLLPQVESMETVAEIRRAVFMPPHGRRRVGGPGNRWVSDFNHATWRQQVEQDLVILPQIESPRGVEVAGEIAKVDFVTALAIGPYDLSTELEVCWQPDSPKLRGAIERIRSAADSAGKNTMMVGDGPTLVSRGFTFVCVAEPTSFLEAALKAHVASLRAGGISQDSSPKSQVP